MPNSRSGSMFSRITGVFDRKKSLAAQLPKYMEFYYPATSTSKVTYNIIFDWGEYIITTEANLNAEVHKDSKPYLGYITMRPEIAGTAPGTHPQIYLITPDGVVWENTTGENIPAISKREEVIEKKSEFGISKLTNTIQSYSEPVIDHFLANPEKWTLFGNLEICKGKTKLKRVE